MSNKLVNYQDLSSAVNSNEGVITLEMGQLRDIHGAGKLGVNVVMNIHEELERLGLGHVPDELPRDQWKQVRIYRKGSSIARLVEAVHEVNEKNDVVLREFANRAASETLKKIRELLCD